MLPCVRSCAGQKVKSLPAASADRISFAEPLLFLYPKWFQIATHDQQFRSIHTSRSPRPSTTTKQGSSNTSAHILSVRLKSSNTDAPPRRPGNNDALGISSPSAIPSKEGTAKLSGRSKYGLKRKKEVLADTRGGTDLPKGLPEVKHGFTVFDAPEVDGLDLMRLLSKVPPKRIPRWHESKWFSARFVKWLTGTQEENMWVYKDGRGCEIEILAPTDSDPDRCQVLIYGSSGSQEMALQYLKDQVVQFTLAAFSNTPSRTDEADIGEVLAGNGPESLDQYIRVDDIKVPTSWTIRTFYEYVTSVVHHNVPRAIERIMYPGHENYNQVAGKILSNLFSDPHLRPYHSTAALRQALRFFKSKTQLAPEALKIWIEVCESGVVPDISCFNYEIERCLTVRNVARVQYLFHQMAKLWIPPNIETWCLVLKSMKGWTDRLATISFLLRHRTAAPAADKQSLARLVVQSDFARFVQNKTELHEFVEHMSKAFGSDWLSPSIVAEMIQQCLEIDKLQTVSDVLAFAHANNVKLEHESSHLLMDAVRRTKDLKDCMSLFKALAPVQDRREIHSNVELLFKAAWKNCMPNMCRVLWYHAASHGSISYAMQRYIFRPSAHNAGSTSKESTGLTQNLLAAITIGVDSSMDDFSLRFPRLDKTGEAQHLLEYLCRWTENDGTRHEQHQLLHGILEDDLTVWKSYQPMAVPRLLSLLDEAYTLDTQWNNEEYIKSHSPAEILGQSIEINLDARPAEQRIDVQKMLDRTASRKPMPPPTTKPPSPVSANDSASFERSKPVTDMGYTSDHSREGDPEMSKPYSLLSSSLPPLSLLGPVAMSAVAITNSSALDILFQHLRRAWETV